MTDIYDLLYSLGVTANYIGFFHMAYAVSLCVEQPDRLLLVTKWLYPEVAKRYGTNWKAVERILRTVGCIIWRENRPLLEQLARVRESGEAELFFVEAALLIECGYLALVDEMWYIYADEQVRRERLKASRGYSEEKISQIMSKQLTEQRFRESCDFVIDNSGDLAESCRQVDGRLSAFCRKNI